MPINKCIKPMLSLTFCTVGFILNPSPGRATRAATDSTAFSSFSCCVVVDCVGDFRFCSLEDIDPQIEQPINQSIINHSSMNAGRRGKNRRRRIHPRFFAPDKTEIGIHHDCTMINHVFSFNAAFKIAFPICSNDSQQIGQSIWIFLVPKRLVNWD